MRSGEGENVDSPIEEQFRLAYRLNRENRAYNLASLFDISGDFCLSALNETLGILSSRYTWADSIKPIDHISSFSLEELSKAVNEPFELEIGSLVRVFLWEKNDHFYLLFLFHHIIFDLRSKDIFAQEFSEIYNSLRGNREPCLEVVHSYREYTDWYRQFFSSEKYNKMLAYWKQEPLENSTLDLPYDKERSSTPSSRGRRIFGTLPHTLVGKLTSYSHNQGSDPFLILLTAYAVFLNRFSGREQFSIGIPRTNRPGEKFQNTIGCFVNILPLCICIDKQITFKELLRQIRMKMLAMHRNQHIPYIDVVKLNKGKRDAKYNPLFQVGFTFEHPMQLKLDGVEISSLDIAPDAAQLDLFFYFWQEEGIFRWAIEFCTDLFSQERVEGFLASFLTILDQGLDNDKQILSTIPLLDSKSRENINSWNETERAYSLTGGIIGAFLDTAKKNPEKRALLFRDESMTYGELNHRIRILAAFLINRGVGPETVVGLSLERSFEMVIGMYAIVLAGGTYLPIEPALPADYIDYIREDSRFSLVLSKEKFRPLFPNLEGFIALDNFDFSKHEDWVEFPILKPDSRVYILYTSGSTGRPKGVEITHRGLLNRILWMDEEYEISSVDILFQKTPYNFDVSGWELWWPLMKGVPLVIAEPEGHKDNGYLINTIEKENITIIHFVPSMLREFLKTCRKGNCSSLRDVMSSGEALPAAIVREFYEILPHVRLHNLYGPTEASIDVTYWPCKPDCTVVPIGRPVANTKIHILDDALNPIPPGVTGEIYLAGDQLARGYLNKPGLTQERFVTNPFDGRRMYKTGDLGQWNLKGEILYLGRNDSQIQLHGLRIELGEIENRISDHPGVDSAAVIVNGDFGAEQSLVAYIVKRKELSIEELISFLSQRLPIYMVPQRVYFVEEIPLTANGKLDRNSLSDLKAIYKESEQLIILPEGERETYLAGLWKEMLGLNEVGREENFFELGGSSIHIIRLQRELSEHFDRDIPITDLFIHTTIRGLAGYLDSINSSHGDQEKLMNRVELSRQTTHRLKKVRKR